MLTVKTVRSHALYKRAVLYYHLHNMPYQRTFTEAQKRIVAARQSWRCSSCEHLLSSAFQVDHTRPLWDGGADSLDNAKCLCPNCHSIKTQTEGIERAKRKRDAVQAAVLAHEYAIRAQVVSECRPTEEADGTMVCSACNKRYYKLFRHKCWSIEAKVSRRLNSGRRRSRQQPLGVTKPVDNPFIRFAFITS
jgi:Zn finger protein HypA/HybF involved in hydrogenase expression